MPRKSKSSNTGEPRRSKKTEVPEYLQNIPDTKLFPDGEFDENGYPIGKNWSEHNYFGKSGPLTPLYERVDKIIEIWKEHNSGFPRSPVIVKAAKGSANICMRHYNKIYDRLENENRMLKARIEELEQNAAETDVKFAEFRKEVEGYKKQLEAFQKASYFGYTEEEFETAFNQHVYDRAINHIGSTKKPEETFAEFIHNSPKMRECIQERTEYIKNKVLGKLRAVQQNSGVRTSQETDQKQTLPKRGADGRWLPRQNKLADLQQMIQDGEKRDLSKPSTTKLNR